MGAKVEVKRTPAEPGADGQDSTQAVMVALAVSRVALRARKTPWRLGTPRRLLFELAAEGLSLRRVDGLLQACLGLNADKAIYDFAILEQHERGDAADAVALCGVWRVIDVELSNFDRPLVLAGELLDDGRNLAAGAAPRCPKIDEHRAIGIENFALEIVVVKFGYAHCICLHFSSFKIAVNYRGRRSSVNVRRHRGGHCRGGTHSEY